MGSKSRRQKGRVTKHSRPIVLSFKRKVLFAFVALALCAGCFLGLEGILRLVGYGGDSRLFVRADAEVDHFLACNRQIGRRYLPGLSHVPKPSWDVFLERKPPGGVRMFVLGGSTAAGFPYGNNLMFSRILNVKLQDAFPGRKIEIVNTAMSATNTYTQLDFMDEIIARQPDVILIYSGHNEFYGALGIASLQPLGRSPAVARACLKLQRVKLFTLLRDAVGRLGRRAAAGPDFDPTATLMERMVGEQAIPYDSRLYRQGEQQFAHNLDRIYRKARRAGIPVVISELVSNERDQRPFVSVATASSPPAEQVFRAAQSQDRQGDYEQARRLYARARDLDALRFRAAGEFNDVIHRIARKYGSPVVPTKSCFEAASPQGIIGDNLMVDHLHPNIDGCFLMAEVFFDTLKAARLADLPWDDARIRPMTYYQQQWGMTELDTLCADLRIRYLKGGWPFQPKSVPNRSLGTYQPQSETERLALRSLTDDSFSIILAHHELAQRHEKNADYLAAYREYRALYHTIPWATMFLNGAAENLLRVGRYDEVLPLLFRSLEIDETFFAQRWLGHLLVNQGQFRAAIPYLERAIVGHEDNVQVLICLEKAYQHTGHQEQASAIRQRLRALSASKESGVVLPPPAR